MKTLIGLLLLMPTLIWGNQITLLCEAYKTESKDSNSRLFQEIMIFNGVHEPIQTIELVYKNGEPNKMNFSLFNGDLNFSKINDTYIKFGALWWNSTYDAPIKTSIKINRVSLQAQYKWVLGSNKSMTKKEFMNVPVSNNDWDTIIFDESLKDFVMVSHMKCKRADKKI